MEAGAFAARVIGAQASYISHGEIQTGLSLDGKTWISDLGERHTRDFADPGDRDMLVARDGDEVLVGFGIVAWRLEDPMPYGVIEDIAVEPDLRGHGLGGEILDRLVAEVVHRGGKWVFLESGLHNDDAHRFFERHSFEEVSRVFGRRLEVSG